MRTPWERRINTGFGLMRVVRVNSVCIELPKTRESGMREERTVKGRGF